jgi:RNA-binding protein 26
MPNGVEGPTPSQPASQMSMDVDMAADRPMPVVTGPPARGLRPMRGGRGAGRPGIFNGDVQRFRPERRNDKTLVVEKIPDDKLSLETVNEWFKKFGVVTNVAIDASSAKALVSFSTHEEAHVAWKSEDAVFNNRFVKIFWHRPMEGQGQVGQRMLAASAPVVANMSKEAPSSSSSTSKPTPAAEPTAQSPSTSSTTTHSQKPLAAPTSAVSALAAKQQLLEQQIAEQKSLMERLGSAQPEEKKVILTRLRKLGEEMKPISTTPSSTVSAAPSHARRTTKSTPRPDDLEQKERERLDKELEIHSATAAADGKAESRDALMAELAKLKAEVCQHQSYLYLWLTAYYCRLLVLASIPT